MHVLCVHAQTCALAHAHMCLRMRCACSQVYTSGVQAAQDNHFMHAGAGSGVAPPGQAPNVTRTVLREFAGLHHQLTEVCMARQRA